MTIAPNDATPAVTTAPPEAAVADVTVLLPTREALLERLADRMPTAGAQPATLMIIGLLRRDDTWPTTRTTLAQVTALLARSLRGEDWLAGSGPAEFAVLLCGPASAAETAAARLVTAIAALDVPGLSASAGIAPLAADVPATEVFRRATLSLTAARRIGPGTVLQYREPAA